MATIIPTDRHNRRRFRLESVVVNRRWWLSLQNDGDSSVRGEVVCIPQQSPQAIVPSRSRPEGAPNTIVAALTKPDQSAAPKFEACRGITRVARGGKAHFGEGTFVGVDVQDRRCPIARQIGLVRRRDKGVGIRVDDCTVH